MGAKLKWILPSLMLRIGSKALSQERKKKKQGIDLKNKKLFEYAMIVYIEHESRLTWGNKKLTLLE